LNVVVELLKLELISSNSLILFAAAGVKLFQTTPVHSYENPASVSVKTLPIPGLLGN
jgi:hypothetical protein